MSDITISYKGSSIATMDATGTKTLLTEGKYCEDDIEVVYVKPSGGGGLDLSSITTLQEGLRGQTLPEKVFLGSLTTANTNYSLADLVQCKILVLPVISSWGQFIFADNHSLETIDLGSNCPDLKGWFFSSSREYFNKLILRKPSVVAVQNINTFNDTPFASGKSGGTLYVPSALISSYQSATNWSTILGYPNNSIAAIEGSIYETAYADGTPIT